VPRAKSEVESNLLSKGFRQRNHDHRYFIYYTFDGRKSRVRTKTSHGTKHKSIPDDLLSAMGRQCGLTKTEFLKLVDCPMSREEYEELITDRGKI
jgi:hypothetical protein